jgi:hypothetical protein
MKRVLFVLPALMLAVLYFSAAPSAPGRMSADEATARHYGAAGVVERYESVPKGVILEGNANGWDDVASVAYDKDKQSLVINGKETYKLPVSAKEFAQVLKSIQKDDRMGVTLIDGNAKFWGSIENGGNMGRALIDTDKLMGGIIYGFNHLLEGRKLPQGFRPQKAPDRKTPVVAVTRFWRYQFEKKNGQYVLVSDELDVQIFPLDMAGRSGTGGHLPDDELLKNFSLEQSDRDNLSELQRHKSELYKVTSMGETSKVGEVAAVARTLRDSKVDLGPLLKQLK